MGRVIVWILNAGLFVLCCFLTASVVNTVLGQWVVGSPVAHAAPPPAAAPAQRTWADRQVILKKNLFNVSTLLPAKPVEEKPPEPIAEELEETKLPLRLLGTVASNVEAEARAAVEDLQKRDQLVVQVGDKLLDKAEVLRIERRRIVIQNGARQESLSLDDEEGGPARKTAARPARRAPRRAARAPRQPRERKENLRDRVKQLSDGRFQLDRDALNEAVRNPADLFSKARILPKYEDGEMVGVQLNSIKEGSLFQQIGIQNGDTITEVNGIVVSNPQDSATILKELTEADEFVVQVKGSDGTPRTYTYEVPN